MTAAAEIRRLPPGADNPSGRRADSIGRTDLRTQFARLLPLSLKNL
jgi:hypothetical protein